MSNYAIRTPNNHRPFLWSTDRKFAERMARRSHGEVIGPLPDEEAHALGMGYYGRWVGKTSVDFGKSIIYLP